MSFFSKPVVIALFGLSCLAGWGFGLYSDVTAAVYTPLAWSPDGQSLVCNYETAANNGTLVLLPRRGGREVVLHTNKGAQGCYKASFSPDGRRVAFEHMGIHVVGIDGKNKREIADGELKGWTSESSLVIQEDNSKRFEVNIETSTRLPYLGKPMVNVFLENRLSFPNHSRQRLPNGDVIAIAPTRHPAISRISATTGETTTLAHGNSVLISPKGNCLAYTVKGALYFLDL